MADPDAVTVRHVPRAEVAERLGDLAALRIAVFREWPYLYDGSEAYERDYLRTYAESERAVVAGAFHRGRMVGAATGTPLMDHADDFAAPLAGTGWDLARTFYLAESVLLPAFRGRGLGHAFFGIREAAARAMGFERAVFASVIRPEDHPMRPGAPRDLGPFWRGRGYAPLEGAVATFEWTDVGQTGSTPKPLQIWWRNLAPRNRRFAG